MMMLLLEQRRGEPLEEEGEAEGEAGEDGEGEVERGRMRVEAEVARLEREEGIIGRLMIKAGHYPRWMSTRLSRDRRL